MIPIIGNGRHALLTSYIYIYSVYMVDCVYYNTMLTIPVILNLGAYAPLIVWALRQYQSTRFPPPGNSWLGTVYTFLVDTVYIFSSSFLVFTFQE
jgi:hypothetical protein